MTRLYKFTTDAEKVFLPCFNQLLMDFDTISLENCRAEQSWESVKIIGEEKSYSVTWHGKIPMCDFNRIVFAISLPEGIIIDSEVICDGEKYVLFKGAKGSDDHSVEIFGDIDVNGVITQIKLNFICLKDGIINNRISLYWGAVVNKEMVALQEASMPKYTVDSWKPYLNENAVLHTDYNVYFSNEEISNIKSKINDERFNYAFSEIYKNAERLYNDYDAVIPETEIREYLPGDVSCPSFTRERDWYRTPLKPGISYLSVAGYFFDKPEWSYMAARLVICAAVTPYWFEGPQCNMEDSTWHQVCFVEAETISAIAMAMGFLGGMFSESGLELILNSMETHFKTVVKCCEEKGYRRYSNQGIVETASRLVGACCFANLGKKKYIDDIEISYQRHLDMLADYLSDDGHCLEGRGYYEYSLEYSVLLWKAYANFKKVSLKDVIPDRVEKSLDYIDAMTSSCSEEGKAMPLNDSHSNYFDELLLNTYVSIYDWPMGRKMLEARKNNPLQIDIRHINVAAFLMNCALSTNNVSVTETPEEEKYYIFEKSGLGVYEWSNGKFWFCAEGNPKTGHYHPDRGSVVLEVAGNAILAEPGVMSYDHAFAGLVKTENYHNVAHPDGIPMIVQSEIANISANEAGIGCRTVVTLDDFEKPSARVNYIKKAENGMEFSADTRELFGEKVLKAERNGNIIVNGDIIELQLNDVWKFTDDIPLCINFMSYSPWKLNEKGAKTRIFNVSIEIRFESEVPYELTSDDTVMDFDLKQLYRLRLKTDASHNHIVKSRIIISSI